MTRVAVSGRVAASGRVAVSGRTTIAATENVILYSRDIDQVGAGAWQRLTLAASPSPIATAPDGTSTARAVVPDNTNALHRLIFGWGPLITASTPLGRTCLFRAYFQRGALCDWVRVLVNNNAAGGYFDLATGAVGSQVGTSSASIVPASVDVSGAGSSWWLVRFFFTYSAISGQIWCAQADGGGAFLGDGVSTALLLWDVQCARSNHDDVARQPTSGAIVVPPPRATP